MSEPAAITTTFIAIEIIPPAKCSSELICECCTRPKSSQDFDEDSFGICSDCLASGAIIFGRETNLLQE
jgi:hypothetical protein